MRSSEAVIPECPDLTEFLKNWYDWHRGYRIIRYDDGREEHQILVGERLEDVPPGHLPRHYDESRSPVTSGRNDRDPSSTDVNPSTQIVDPSLLNINPEDRIFDDDLAIHSIEHSLQHEQQGWQLAWIDAPAVRQDHSFSSYDTSPQHLNTLGRHPTHSLIQTQAQASINTVQPEYSILAASDRTRHAEATARSHQPARRQTHLRQEVEVFQEVIEHVMSEIREFGTYNRPSNWADMAESYRTSDQHRVSRDSRRTQNSRARAHADAAAIRNGPQQPSRLDSPFQNRYQGPMRTMPRDLLSSSPRPNPLLQDQEAGHESPIAGMYRRAYEQTPGTSQSERPPPAPTPRFPDGRQDLLNLFTPPNNRDLRHDTNGTYGSLYRNGVEAPSFMDPYDGFFDTAGTHFNTGNLSPLSRQYLANLETYGPQDPPFMPHNRDIRREPYSPMRLNTNSHRTNSSNGFASRPHREHRRRNAYTDGPPGAPVDEPSLDKADGRPEPQTDEQMKAEQMKQDPACKICFSQPATVAILPCGKLLSILLSGHLNPSRCMLTYQTSRSLRDVQVVQQSGNTYPYGRLDCSRQTFIMSTLPE